MVTIVQLGPYYWATANAVRPASVADFSLTYEVGEAEVEERGESPELGT